MSRHRPLTQREVDAIRRSDHPNVVLAARYGVTVYRIAELRAGDRGQRHRKR